MVYVTKTKKLRLDRIMMAGRYYDFLYDQISGQLSCRETAHLGGTFAPITPGNHYSWEVNKVLKDTADRFVRSMLCN